jgi:hypothetical protein
MKSEPYRLTTEKTNTIYENRKHERIILCPECPARVKLSQMIQFVEWSDEKCKICRRPLNV